MRAYVSIEPSGGQVPHNWHYAESAVGWRISASRVASAKAAVCPIRGTQGVVESQVGKLPKQMASGRQPVGQAKEGHEASPRRGAAIRGLSKRGRLRQLVLGAVRPGMP